MTATCPAGHETESAENCELCAAAGPPSRPTPLGVPRPRPEPEAVGEGGWVIELWVDPQWYAAQEVEEPCPPPGAPVVIPVDGEELLVGRTSTSRNITPQVDCTGDNGVSRRHALLGTDGQGWWVEDLGSANGTFVAGPGEPLPHEAIEPGLRVRMTSEGRVYLGAWTRITVRPAAAAERRG